MAFTIGFPSPGQITQNLDTVLTLAFANAGDSIFDQISKNNAIFYDIKKNGMYEGVEAPEPYLEIPLMYGLGNAEWYEGWDTLGTQPTEGITAVVFPWRQLACPAGYNRREARVTNPARIKEISKVKIEQAQITMVETFNRAFLQGNINTPGGLITSPMVSSSTGRSGLESLPALIYYQASSNFAKVSTSFSVGGLNQSTNAWWANWSHDASGITTYAGLLAAFDQMMEQCGLGPGGMPNIIYTDITTRRLLNTAYYAAFRRNMESDNNYPFDNLKFRNALVITDELIANAHSGTADTSVASGLGTAYFVNTKFMKIKYDTQCNFTLTDLQKPVNQDGKVGHVMWMGNAVMNNRRKHGVIGDLARTLT